MPRFISTLLILVLSGCHAGLELPLIYGAPSLTPGEAQFANSESGAHTLKDIFVVSKVDGRDVVVSARPTRDEITVRCGRHDLEISFRGYRGPLHNTVRATATISLDIAPDRRYRVAGKVEEKLATLWIEDAISGALISREITAEVKNFSDYDPLLSSIQTK